MGKNGGKGRTAFSHVTVIVDNAPMCRNQIVLIAWHRPFLKAHIKFMLNAVEQTA